MANQALVRRINQARIMNAIRLHSPVSRSGLADLLSLDRKSITNLIAELLHEGLVHETGKRHTGSGRPLTLVEFCRDSKWVLGLSLSAVSAKGVLVDLYGRERCTSVQHFPFSSPLPVLREAVSAVCERLLGHGMGRILGIGLAVPGILDTSCGQVRRSVNLPALDGCLLPDLLPPAARSFPLAIEESSRAKALAEKWFGLGRDVSSFVCVDLGIGIGAGIIQDRRLYAGDSGYVGEIGHLLIERDGASCRCGHHGCLEAYVSEDVLLAQLSRSEGREVTSFAALDSLNERSAAVLRAAGYRLGLGLSYLVNIICPPLIVLSGPITRFAATWLPDVERGLDQGALPACRERLQLRSSSFTNAGAMGAAAAAMSHWFEVNGHVYV